MKKSNTYTAEYVLSVLDYTADSGKFIWKNRPKYHFKNARSHSVWNKRYAGKEAGCLQKTGYIAMSLDNVKVYAHRIVFLLENGEWPENQVDHINGNRSDNRRSNLRLATRNQNQHNRSARLDNKLGIKGVCKHKQCNRYQAKIWVNSKCIHLGLFETQEEAKEAYRVAALKYHIGYTKET